MREKLKEQGHNFSFNPRETIQYLQITKLIECARLKTKFIEEQNYLGFLSLYYSNQQIYWAGYCNKEKCSDGRVMKICINLLFMRRAKDSVKKIINGLLEGEKETQRWFQSAKIFLETYKEEWKSNLPFEDKDMKRSIEDIKRSIQQFNNPVRTRRVLPASPCERQNGKRNRSSSLT